MATKMSQELLERVQESAATDPESEIPVIVTVKAGADVASLEQQGMKVKRVFSAISAASGTIPAQTAQALEGLDEVEKIEYDGQMYAQ